MADQLECRIVIRHRADGRIDLGMHDPRSGRYEPLGAHGPGADAITRAVRGLAERIEREGHRLTWSEASAK